jgi:hypothetical protein
VRLIALDDGDLDAQVEQPDENKATAVPIAPPRSQ